MYRQNRSMISNDGKYRNTVCRNFEKRTDEDSFKEKFLENKIVIFKGIMTNNVETKFNKIITPLSVLKVDTTLAVMKSSPKRRNMFPEPQLCSSVELILLCERSEYYAQF